MATMKSIRLGAVSVGCAIVRLHDVREEDLRQAKLLKTEDMYTGKLQ